MGSLSKQIEGPRTAVCWKNAQCVIPLDKLRLEDRDTWPV
jgi:hypothetical protein